MTTRSVLIADDHVEMARLLGDKLREEGWRPRVVDSGKAAIESLNTSIPDLVITDLRMAEVDGLDVLDAVRAIDPDVPVIIMTAFGAIETAIEAMKRGAWHYVVKPARLDELALHANRAFEHRTLRRVNRQLRDENRTGMSALVGKSAVMRELYSLIERVALSAAPVLLRGESGSGKELVARALHEAGPRKDKPFLAINCTALPESLLESELFGHTRGAFTGATSARAGLFVEASGGTLFLDEIGDMAPTLQAKLLRVVQQGEVRPVGSDESRAVDVRVVAATHQDLEQRVAEGNFRQDLFYRLNVVPIVVPALRERLEDIPVLVEHFLAAARGRNPHSPVVRFSPEIVTTLTRYLWPGNVRELENRIKRAVSLTRKEEISAEDLAIPSDRGVLDADTAALTDTREAFRKRMIQEVLSRNFGNVTRTATELGISRQYLSRLISRFNIKVYR